MVWFEHPVTMFRPAPIVRSARPTSITAIEPTFTWNYSTPLSPPMPRAIVEVIGQGITPCPDDYPASSVRVRQVASDHSSVRVEGCGGWWLDEARVPQYKSSAAFGATPPVVVKPSVSSNWWEPCDRDAGNSTCDVAPMLKPAPTATGQLSGTWYREIEGAVVAATFSGNELTLCIELRRDGQMLTFTISADFAVTKDGTVHGVVTGADVEFRSRIEPLPVCR